MSADAARLLLIAWGERRSVLRALRRGGIAERDLPDALQATMLLAWQLLLRGDFNPEASTTDERTALRRWIAAVAYNAARVHRRKMPPRCEVFEDNIGGLDLAGRIESRETMRDVFARLNRVETTLMRGVAEGMTLDELGAQTRMPAGTVATKIRAVRRVLRKRAARAE